ncbi:MAG: 16S rRNA (uracil(1498)-N(3))-methyltransferase [Planctomycetaceae bacterium]|nr:16S rRNA (uracil(1498)-N(3))-methyltransferase [Planctomycetaceae bacterium]
MAFAYYWEKSPDAARDSAVAVITGDEARHLIRVMRQKAGDRVTLFDGIGNEFDAVIREIKKDRVFCDVTGSRKTVVEPACRVTIAVSLPKGDRQKWLVEKLTELGCFRLIPLKTERGVARCSEEALERLRRQVLEASKQCGRSVLMQVSPEMSIAECHALFEREKTESGTSDFAAFIAHPISDAAVNQKKMADVLKQASTLQQVLVLVGPEGGFSQDEIQAALDFDFQPLDLGKRILRVETAAIFCAVVFSAVGG